MAEKTFKILVIDDEISICELLTQSLREHDYECEYALSAALALAALGRENFDLALIDIRLPDLSGVELLKKIKSSYPAISAIMLTAVDDLATAVESMKAGAQDYLTKPFDLEKLEQTIRAVVSLKAGIALQDNADFKEIEAIALGVEARQDMLDVYSERVIHQTVTVARQIGLSEEMIQQWVAVRSLERSKKIKQVTDSFFKMV